MGGERIKLRILIPLTIAIVGLLGAFVTGAFRLKQNALDSQVNQYLSSVKKVLKSAHHSEIESMGRVLDNLQSNKRLRQVYSDRDSTAFLAAGEPIFHELCRNHDINALYYYDSNGSIFATLNERTIGSESFEHSTLIKAMASGKPFFGMELSDAGSFFLSYTVPWEIDDWLVGFIELEKELKHITKDVPPAFGVNLISVVDKRYISRNLWEQIYLPRHQGLTWNSYPDFVVVDNTFSGPPPLLDKPLSANPTGNANTPAEILSQEGEYAIASFPLIDVHNRTVGYSAVFYDASLYLRETRDLLYLISTLCIIIGVALFVSFYKMLDSLEQELMLANQRMVEENQLRLEIERRHTKELAAHVLELEVARTRALNMAREAQMARTSAEEVRQKLHDSQSRISK